VASLHIALPVYMSTARQQISFLQDNNRCTGQFSCGQNQNAPSLPPYYELSCYPYKKMLLPIFSPYLSGQDMVQLRFILEKPQESEDNKKQVNHGGI
jgi:hypothetical protein